MTEVIWATAFDKGYAEKAQPYLDSLQRCHIPTTVFSIDFTHPDYTRVDSRKFKCPAQINCIQHGEFLPYVEGNPTIVFTDSDIECQRRLSSNESLMLQEWPEGQVGVTFNNGEGDSLLHEALRLGPQKTLDEIFSRFEWNRHPMYMPCYNTGVIVAKKATYQKLYDAYCGLYYKVDDCFAGYAKQQWLLSYLLESMKGVEVRLLPGGFHEHGCFSMVRPVPARMQFYNNVLAINGKIVLLRHNWTTPYWQADRIL